MKNKLLREFVMFLSVVGIIYVLTPMIILSNENKLSQYSACSKNGGLEDYSHFSSFVECKDGEKVLWK